MTRGTSFIHVWLLYPPIHNHCLPQGGCDLVHGPVLVSMTYLGPGFVTLSPSLFPEPRTGVV